LSQPAEPPSRTALVAGSTGLVGGYLLDALLADPDYREVTALPRRSAGRQHEKLREVVVDFDDLPGPPELFAVDEIFCCLGTTIRKAGSREAFRRVDHGYVESLARRGREGGAPAFFFVSSIGTEPGSGNFYLRVKAEAEAAVLACGYREVHIFRPSMLMGPRGESRPAERLGIALGRLLAPLLLGSLRVYRPIHARTVARAMLGAARGGQSGLHVHTFGDILRLAGEAGA